MKHLLNKFLFILIVSILTANIAQAKSLCSSKGFVVGYFNGMNNRPHDALRAKKNLQATLSSEIIVNESVNYEVFYNSTTISNLATLWRYINKKC